MYIHICNKFVGKHVARGTLFLQVDYDLPVVVHARDADDDTLEVMRLGVWREFSRSGHRGILGVALKENKLGGTSSSKRTMQNLQFVSNIENNYCSMFQGSKFFMFVCLV